MPRLVVSPIALYPMRPGAAIMAWKPKVHLYAAAYGMVTLSDPTTGAPLRNWSLCRVHSWVDQAGAEADPDLFFFPDGLGLDTVLGANATMYQTVLFARFGLVVTLLATDSYREALNTIGQALDPSFSIDAYYID